MIWIRLAWRELLNARRFSIFFILNLALGLTGYIVVDSLKSSISQSLAGKSREILGSDLAISAFRQLNDDELKTIEALLPEGTQTAREVSWLSMVSAIGSETDSTTSRNQNEAAPPARLMEIRAVDADFPFYGSVDAITADGSLLPASIFQTMTAQPHAIAGPELLFQLNSNIGDKIRIGQQVFTIIGTIANDSSTSSTSFSIAPRIYIGRVWAAKTGLIQLGSRITHTTKFRLPDFAQDQVETIEANIKSAFRATPDIRIRGHKSATDELGRVLKFLGDYLGIVSLVAMILSAIGCNFLILSFLRSKIRDLGILQAVGASPSSGRLLTAIQLLILGSAGAVTAIAIAAVLMPLVKEVLAPFLGAGVRLHLRPDSIIVAGFLGSIGTFLASLPVFVHLKQMNPAALFREHQNPTRISSLRWITAMLPALALLFGLATLQSQSPKTAALFLATTGGAIALLAIFGWIVLSGARLVIRSTTLRQRTGLWPILMALRQAVRSRQMTLVSFVTLGLCATLVSAVPQVQAILTGELMTGDKAKLPGLFLFDIQPEQEEPLAEFLKARDLQLNDKSPLVRARLEKINNIPVSETFDNIPGTRERATEERFKNRTYNLTIRGQLFSSETIVSGRPFSSPAHDPNSQTLPELSLEKRFADRTNIKLGDVLEFNIQGVPVQGEVVNFRRVRWTSFQPNFFVQFQEGVIDDAPRTTLGTVPQVSFEATQTLQRELARSFPNVSIVDVKASIKRILSVSEQIALAISAMALLCLIAGLSVLAAITIQQSKARAFEITVLKVLGSSFREIQIRLAAEAALTATFGAACGFLVSFAVAWVISMQIFQGAWVFAAQAALIPALTIAAASAALTFFTARIALLRDARDLLTGDTTTG